ncbi:MAG: hypothetical protein EA389_00815, partial [Ilumatobacter sp.]
MNQSRDDRLEDDRLEDSLMRRFWARAAARTVKLRADLAVAVLDVVLVCSAFVAMLLLRFDGSVPADQWEPLLTFLPFAVIVFVLSNSAFGLYGQLWRHASLYEARRLVMSGSVATLILVMLELGPRHVP